MPEWLKELLISIGGGSVVAVIFYIGLKTAVVKIVDKAIDASFERSTLKLSNRLERTTKAYEILLKKEFDYYEKLDPYLARIIPLVQDLVYNVDEFQNNNIKVILYFTENEYTKIMKILQDLNLQEGSDLVLIDARANKISASNAG